MSDDDHNHGCTVGGDVIQVIGVPETPDGPLRCVRHTKDHEIEFGNLHPLREGRPIVGELLRARPRADGLFEVQDDHEAGSGPANVNSKAYLDGWDRIFGNRAATGQA